MLLVGAGAVGSWYLILGVIFFPPPFFGGGGGGGGGGALYNCGDEYDNGGYGGYGGGTSGGGGFGYGLLCCGHAAPGTQTSGYALGSGAPGGGGDGGGGGGYYGGVVSGGGGYWGPGGGSGYVGGVTNTTLTAGNASMPAPGGGTETGHTGTGYARITYTPIIVY